MGNQDLFMSERRIIKKRAILFVLLMVGIAAVVQLCASGACLQQGESESKQAADEAASAYASGPTIYLDYQQGAKLNPTPDFMYFVPLISPTLVDRQTSADSEQTGRMISCRKKTRSRTFSVTCEFQMIGKGVHTNRFDPQQMIEHRLKDHKKGRPLENILEYIRFHGEGEGRMEVHGRNKGSKQVVTEVVVHFVNGRGNISPVTIGLCRVKCVNGQYKCENSYGRIVARVNTLSFKRCEGIPKMKITLASLNKAGAKESFWAKLWARVVSLVIPVLEVDKLGNDTMLDFGLALYRGEPTFTFPRARNLKEERTATDSKNRDVETGSAAAVWLVREAD